ncbi:hypothetical protein [Micromonospora sp. NPDC005324]|uniref:hypothetical protein n=1 Tax=Micromonospora sp. NPDC005324 TaxID=3157033 RepID=UPI00339FAB9E
MGLKPVPNSLPPIERKTVNTMRIRWIPEFVDAKEATMNGNNVTAPTAIGDRRQRHTRRGLLGFIPLVAVATVLAAKPAQASPGTVECLADLMVAR